MRIQRITLKAIAVIFLLFCIHSILIEAGSCILSGKQQLFKWLNQRPEMTESELNDHLFARLPLFEYRGLFNRIIDKRYIYGLYKLKDGHLAAVTTKTKLDDKFENLGAFNDWCSEHGIPLLYINLPAKNENVNFMDYGVTSYSGENADNFLAGLEERGIDHMDMREYFPAAAPDYLDLFFKTEHHWKISSGLFAARTISRYINERYHLGLDTDAISDDKMRKVYMPQCWTGEFGKRTSVAFAGKDDFEYITPVDPGSFHLTIPDRKIDKTGDFSVMINDSVFQDPDLYGDSFYYAYLFGNDSIQTIDNLEERSGRILIIKDSFGLSVDPFLAMTADELICWDVRHNKTDIREYLAEHPVDLVVVMYTETFIQSRLFRFTGSE